MKKLVLLAVVPLLLSACSKQVEETADTGYHYSKGRVDKAKKDIKNAEDIADQRIKDAEKYTESEAASQ